MIRILVVSDSHGSARILDGIIRLEYPFDYFVFCGDGVPDAASAAMPADVSRIVVPGNMDGEYRARYDPVARLSIGGKVFMITHGDLFGAHRDLDALRAEGARSACDTVIFGHTHIPFLGSGKPVLFNPGAVNKGCYGIITVDAAMRFEHRKLELR